MTFPAQYNIFQPLRAKQLYYYPRSGARPSLSMPLPCVLILAPTSALDSTEQAPPCHLSIHRANLHFSDPFSPGLTLEHSAYTLVHRPFSWSYGPYRRHPHGQQTALILLGTILRAWEHNPRSLPFKKSNHNLYCFLRSEDGRLRVLKRAYALPRVSR